MIEERLLVKLHLKPKDAPVQPEAADDCGVVVVLGIHNAESLVSISHISKLSDFWRENLARCRIR
jgi:hypothetical protein